MNPIKSPHQLLLEEAGASLDPSPGLVNTPQQMLMQQANILPHLALGGAVTPADMQAALIVNGNTPQHFATAVSLLPVYMPKAQQTKQCMTKSW